MNEDDLAGLWTTLEPDAMQRQRMDARVRSWLDARDTPLAAEWLALFRFAPISGIGLVAVERRGVDHHDAADLGLRAH